MTHDSALDRNRFAKDIAIIGMACIYPGAGNLVAFWQNIVSQVDAITDVPPDRWDPDIFFDPDTSRNDRVYCKKGGYLGELATFDPLEFGIMPIAVKGGDPGQFLALKVAQQALNDAGYSNKTINHERTEIILGRGNYLDRGNCNVTQHSRILDQTLDILKKLHPEYTTDELKSIRKELKDRLPYFGPENVPSLIPNITTGRIANRLDLMGPNYTVDAACASSLIATELGIQDLLADKCDLALVGGIFILPDVPFSIIFAQLNALSKQNRIKPFDKNADGTIIGEGVGILALKRLEDAEKDKDRIYAIVKGVGTSSDGRGLSVTAPRVEGEELALRRAYDSAGITTESIELIECHGTGTIVGDTAEIEALSRVFGNKNSSNRCAIGTVKSMIGHAMPAAGAAGLIKAALSLYHKVLPPTIHCDEPHPKIAETPFYINTEARPWIHINEDAPRRAGVNAFGFGGVNAHIILEEYQPQNGSCQTTLLTNWDTEVVIIEAETRIALIERTKYLDRIINVNSKYSLKDIAYTLNTGLTSAQYRLAIVATSIDDLSKKLQRCTKKLSDPSCDQIKDRTGIYFFENPISRGGKLAFLFPGEGAQYVNMLLDLCIHFPEVRECFDEIDKAFFGHERGYYPSQVIFPIPAFSDKDRLEMENRIWQMDGAVEAVFTANKALFTLLSKLDLKFDVVLGHSTGEFSAMLAAGMAETEIRRIRMLNSTYEAISAQGGITRADMIAVGADYDTVSKIVEGINGKIFIAMDNCPHQVVVVGENNAVEQATAQFSNRGLICEKLSFDRAYHTPLFEPVCEKLREFFSDQKVCAPVIEAWTCTTGKPYPKDEDEIRRLAADHWKSPVQFRSTIESLYDAGVRIFIEVGPRGNLTAFVDDILRNKPHLAIPSNLPKRSGIMQLNHLAGMISAQNIPIQLDYLYSRRSPQHLSLSEDDSTGNNKESSHMKLELGFPLISIEQRLNEKLSPDHDLHDKNEIVLREMNLNKQKQPFTELPELESYKVKTVSEGHRGIPHNGSRSEVMEQYLQTMENFLSVQYEVMGNYLSSKAGTLSQGNKSASYPVIDNVNQEQRPEVLLLESDTGINSGENAEVLQIDHELIARTVLELISERTGYPVEMLNLNADMEADLGIDSIKRIEILGAFQEKFSLSERQINMEMVASIRTIQDVIDLCDKEVNAARESAKKEQMGNSHLHRFPLIKEIISHISNKELVARSLIDLNECLFIDDHTLGNWISATDNTMKAMCSIPMTVSMEIMAEAASLLITDKLLIGMQDVRARHWITVEDRPANLEIRVYKLDSPTLSKVRVEIWDVENNPPSESGLSRPTVEGIVLFDDSYPIAPIAHSLTLQQERNPKYTAQEMYAQKIMFHGPRFQGITRLNRIGENGIEGELEVLPNNNLFRSTTDPEIVIDPFLLDAAGQFVGYWPFEYLERDFVLFPVHIEEFKIFGPKPKSSERFIGQVRILDVKPRQIRANIDIVGMDGKIFMRLIGWEDWRFRSTWKQFDIWRNPKDSYYSNVYKAATTGLPLPNDFICRNIELLGMEQMIWKDFWIHMILTKKEREILRNLSYPQNRINKWLFGRWAAKDAVRNFLNKSCGLSLSPVDIEIITDEFGYPSAQGKWKEQTGKIPQISIAHCDDMTIAIAGVCTNGQRLGVDIEKIRVQQPGFEKYAFTPEERTILESIEDSNRAEWVIRFWCAKETVAKALGRGFIGNPYNLVVKEFNSDTGKILVIIRGQLAELFPEYKDNRIIAYTFRDGLYIVATSLCERSR